jgi:hypothetical protein
MKATTIDMLGTVIATAREIETEIGFPDYIEKAETGAIGKALAISGYGTLQAPEFDDQQNVAPFPSAIVVFKPKNGKSGLYSRETLFYFGGIPHLQRVCSKFLRRNKYAISKPKIIR